MATTLPPNLPFASRSTQPLDSQKKHKKLARLPPTHKISKRPLLHPAIPSPRTSASTPKVIYISASTPFISILKRARKLLNHVEDRSAGEIKLTRDGRETFRNIEKGLSNGGKAPLGRVGNGKVEKEKPRDEEIQLRATGKAIQKALQVGLRMQAEEGWRVRFETGSVGAVDDIVERMRPKKAKGGRKDRDREAAGGEEEEEEIGVDGEFQAESGDVVMDDAGVAGEEAPNAGGNVEEVEIEESRVRRVSCLIIYVCLK